VPLIVTDLESVIVMNFRFQALTFQHSFSKRVVLEEVCGTFISNYRRKFLDNLISKFLQCTYLSIVLLTYTLPLNAEIYLSSKTPFSLFPSLHIIQA
jgi:hypothetical protein